MAFFCCSSATGAKVIAILSIISSVFLLLMFSGLVVYGSYRMEKLDYNEETLFMARGLFGSFLDKLSALQNNSTSQDNDEQFSLKNNVTLEFLQKNIDYFGFNFSLLYVFIAVYHLIASIELLQGVRQKNYWRCNSWLRWYIGAFLVSFVSVLLVIIFMTKDVTYKLIQCIIGWPIALYFIYVVYDFMKELKQQEKQDGKHRYK